MPPAPPPPKFQERSTSKRKPPSCPTPMAPANHPEFAGHSEHHERNVHDQEAVLHRRPGPPAREDPLVASGRGQTDCGRRNSFHVFPVRAIQSARENLPGI